MEKKRIDYIDAMRGVTMLLVVYAHVSWFCLGTDHIDAFSYNNLFSEFRMPLFFFVSGFLFYKKERIWNFEVIRNFVNTKLRVQIISPLLFLFLHCIVFSTSFIHTVFETELMAGYWFTFALFEFFITYILLELFSGITKMKKQSSILRDALLIIVALVFYFFSSPLTSKFLPFNLNPFFSIVLFRFKYFIFFVFGTRVRKYFISFEELLEQGWIIIFAITGYVVGNIILDDSNPLLYRLLFLLIRFCGIIIVFSFFRKYKEYVSSSSIGKTFQYIGKRTLDIYLIHYFFVSPYWKITIDQSIIEYPLLEFCISMFLSIIVVAACLVISNIMRVSPQISFYMFGQKR